ncbi:MAG: DNA repair protein RecN, partial [Vicinamibacterales bacterium]
LIELHGQHEHQTLLDPATHLSALDSFGQLDEVRARTASAYDHWRGRAETCRSLQAAARERTSRLDLATFQLAEIEKTSPKPGEDDELLATRHVLVNAARIERLCNESYAALYERDDAVIDTLGGVWKRVADLATLDPAFEPYLAARDGIKAQLEDLSLFLRRYADTLDTSTGRLQHVEERLAALERLKRKYGPRLDDVMTRLAALRREVEDLDGSEARLDAAERDLAAARVSFMAAAADLAARRRDVARVFVPTLIELLGGLALEGARFEIRFNAAPLPESEWSALGTDRVEFYVSLNPGEEPRPLARIVSGGELSRVMLALKTMTFRARRQSAASRPRQNTGLAAPGMIFDEVDAGIGGRVAGVLGRRLHALAGAFQVLCITHLPQVAAHADAHYLIEKTVDGGRTHTRVIRLSDDRRVDELARMLAGGSMSEAVRASAREMLAHRDAPDEAKGELKSKGESESRLAKARKAQRGA